MRGYVDDAGLSQSPFMPEGFLKTGDVGYADAQGHVYIVDRAKEIIKVKGCDAFYISFSVNLKPLAKSD